MRLKKFLDFALAMGLCCSVGLASAEEQNPAPAPAPAAAAPAAAAPAAPAAAPAPAAPAAPAAQGTPAAQTAEAPAAPKPKPKPDANGYCVGCPVWVSDNVKIWTRSGPSEGYRVTGTRQIGDELTFLRYSDNGRWAQLGRGDDTFWMPLENLTPNMTGAPLVQKLSDEISSLQYRLDNYDNELARRAKTAEDLAAALTRENSQLKSTLANKDATINELDELYREYADRLETKELDMQMRWWMQGAMIALCGAVAGVIFVFIPRPARRQRRDRY
ncbi:TIGR04211 family SH3 domain-containing protein [Anaerobiospirillum sp. NML120449]|uniref:TIGR04211 family SH3 domain-containing protein n=1 Tax=Anaerobiospirillum sp. NML120449 TaxID=2932817 RepID=UPI001FF5F6AE|nr:TIGR04211 family SH3 domain-containing protein [Anaerobiospirillum sp. NML120449]